MVKHRGKNRPQIVTYIIVAILAFVFVYPFWHMVVLSVSDKIFANTPGFKFWPQNFSLDAFKQVFAANTIYIGYLNTIIRTVAGTVLTLVLTFPAAYAMSHKNLPGWSVINFIIVFTMFFGGGLIPTYLNMKELNLLNTRWVLILPAAAGAWNFIIMRNFLSGISKEIEEAARIDGASAFQIMIQVILPLSKSVIAVIAMWSAVWYWNDWYDALTYANRKELQVLQTVVRRLIEVGEEMASSGSSVASLAESTAVSVRAATVMVATIPILVVYPFVQKYLVKGVMVGAVKG